MNPCHEGTEKEIMKNQEWKGIKRGEEQKTRPKERRGRVASVDFVRRVNKTRGWWAEVKGQMQ